MLIVQVKLLRIKVKLQCQ